MSRSTGVHAVPAVARRGAGCRDARLPAQQLGHDGAPARPAPRLSRARTEHRYRREARARGPRRAGVHPSRVGRIPHSRVRPRGSARRRHRVLRGARPRALAAVPPRVPRPVVPRPGPVDGRGGGGVVRARPHRAAAAPRTARVQRSRRRARGDAVIRIRGRSSIAPRRSPPTSTISNTLRPFAIRWCTEVASIEGDAARAMVASDVVLALAHERDAVWVAGELALWRRRSGIVEPCPAGVAEPFAAHVAGDWAKAATLWEQYGCPYEAALGRAASPTTLRHSAACLMS